MKAAFFALTLLVAAPARCETPADAEMKAALIRLSSELSGFDENKAWLRRLPLRVEKLSAKLAARYDPPSAAFADGAILVNETYLLPSLRALDALGLRGDDAKDIVVWFLLPVILHEAQHAIQVHEYKRRGAFDVYFIESEVEAAAVEATAYLQIIERRPDVARAYVPLKGQQNATLSTWRSGFEPFREDIVSAYRSLVPIPTLDGAHRYFSDQAVVLRTNIEDLEAELAQPRSEEDRKIMTDMIAASRAALAELGDAAKVQATIAYVAEQDAHARALWSAWARSDAQRRLSGEPDLPRRERARLALSAARQLSIISPTANADDIDRLLELSRSEALAGRDVGQAWRAARMQQAAPGMRVEYGVDVLRARGAVDDLGILEKVLEVNVEHLRTRVLPGDFAALEREARRILADRRAQRQ